MPANNAATAALTDEARAIIGVRVFDAPRDLVFSMWMDPEHISRWWGPRGFTTTTQEMEFKPGGVWRHIMHGPDGRDYPNKIIYREIVRPERIVYSHVSGPPFESTVTFTEKNGKTTVIVQMLFETAEMRDRTVKEFGAVEGLQQTLGRLEEELKKMAGEEKEFVISRTFNAPRDLMWKVWTEPERLAKWFGPKGVTIFHSKNDLRSGGIYHYGMRTPDGKDMWGKWVYREVVKPERLVFVNSFSDPKGGVTRHPLSKDWPLEMLTKITFAESGGKTTVAVHWSPINATEAERKTFNTSFDSMKQGWTGTFDKLEPYLAEASDKELTITRVFDAPRELMFKAWTDPKQMAKWFGPRGFTTTISQHDARPGGATRIDMRGPDGTVYPGKGIFREVVPPERLVLTTFALDQNGNELLENLNTVTFEDVKGKTKLTLHVQVIRSKPEAAPYIAGMQEGWNQTIDRLQELVESAR